MDRWLRVGKDMKSIRIQKIRLQKLKSKDQKKYKYKMHDQIIEKVKKNYKSKILGYNRQAQERSTPRLTWRSIILLPIDCYLSRSAWESSWQVRHPWSYPTVSEVEQERHSPSFLENFGNLLGAWTDRTCHGLWRNLEPDGHTTKKTARPTESSFGNRRRAQA